LPKLYLPLSRLIINGNWNTGEILGSQGGAYENELSSGFVAP
jgi:hypothetical protein